MMYNFLLLFIPTFSFSHLIKIVFISEWYETKKKRQRLKQTKTDIKCNYVQGWERIYCECCGVLKHLIEQKIAKDCVCKTNGLTVWAPHATQNDLMDFFAHTLWYFQTITLHFLCHRLSLACIHSQKWKCTLFVWLGVGMYSREGERDRVSSCVCVVYLIVNLNF